jgi:hypothetical protein
LYIAAQNGHFDVVCHLLEVGADKDHASNRTATPLHIAAQWSILMSFVIWWKQNQVIRGWLAPRDSGVCLSVYLSSYLAMLSSYLAMLSSYLAMLSSYLAMLSSYLAMLPSYLAI